MLRIRCVKHPHYRAIRAPKRMKNGECQSCRLLYILRWQFEKSANERLGGLNPYQFISERGEGLRVTEDKSWLSTLLARSLRFHGE